LDLKPALVLGVEVQLSSGIPGYKKTYFEWMASSLVASLKTNNMSGGVLQADDEMFYVVLSTARYG
jgi:hypothetical protein